MREFENGGKICPLVPVSYAVSNNDNMADSPKPQCPKHFT